MTTKEESEDINNVQILKDADTNAMWDFEIKILFRAKELMDIVDGNELLTQQGTDAAKIKQWKMRDAKAQHYIVKTIDRQVKSHILTCNTSKEMYDTLKIIYRKDTTAQKCFLLQEFYNYKYNKTKDMMSNISHIRNIAYKLNQLNQQIDDIMTVTKIINILPEQYKHFSSAWNSTTETDRTLENLASRTNDSWNQD